MQINKQFNLLNFLHLLKKQLKISQGRKTYSQKFEEIEKEALYFGKTARTKISSRRKKHLAFL